MALPSEVRWTPGATVERSRQGRNDETDLFEMIQLVREESTFRNSAVSRFVVPVPVLLTGLGREKISTAFTRSPRFCGVKVSEGCSEQRVLLFQVKEARKEEKVVGGRGWKE